MPTKPRAHNHATIKPNKLAYDKQRGSAQQRGYNAEWNRYSTWRKAQEPFCAACARNGVQTLAECLGHIKPGFAFPELFYDPDNHEPLCNACNKRQDIIDRRRYPAGGTKNCANSTI